VRILFLALDINLCGRTGDSTHVRELTASFSKVGNVVSLVGYAPEDSLDQIPGLFTGENVNVLIPKERGDLAILRLCRKLVKEFRPDAIYERRFSPKMSVTLGKMSGISSVVEINGMVEEEKKLLGREEKGVPGLSRIKGRVRKYFLKSASGIVAVSSGIGKALVDEYNMSPSKIHVIHNGANTDLFRPMKREDCIARLGLDLDLRYICFSGNLAPWQGVEHLISALPSLSGEFEDLHLLVVGDGVQRDGLERSVENLGLQETVSFRGLVPYEEVPYYLGSAEICVAPFSGMLRNVKYKISPIKLYEYMACGRPFVTTSVCDMNEEITDNDVGVVIAPDDPGELRNALADLLKDEERARAMGESGRILAEREHSWNSVASRVVKILEEAS